MAAGKEGYSLRSHWKRKWEQDPKRGPYRGNIHRDSAQLKRIVDDIGEQEARRLINFYFEVGKNISFVWFLYNYDKLRDEADRRDADRAERKALRDATRRRMEERNN